VVPLAGGSVVEFDIDDVMSILIRHLNHTNHIVRCAEISMSCDMSTKVSYQGNVFYFP
jgi:hypothetical protein